MKDMQFRKYLILIIILTGVGQVTNTIFIPAFNDIATQFNTPIELLPLSVASFLISYGLFQFIHGPLSDRLGRKPVILVNLVFFIVACVFGAYVTCFTSLIIISFVMGIGIAVGGVMCRTVMKDLYFGTQLQKANSYMVMCLILAPLIAPIIGGFLASIYHWRLIFVFLACYGLLTFFIILFRFKETNPDPHKQSFFKPYKKILNNKKFNVNLLLLVVISGALCIFEVSSGALFTSSLGLSPFNASLLFVVPLPFSMLGSYISSKLTDKYSLEQISTIGCSLLLLSGVLMIAIYKIYGIRITGILLPGSLLFAGAGIILPTATTKAIDNFPTMSGTAGALIGGLQNFGGGIITASACFAELKNQLWLANIITILAAFSLMALLIEEKYIKRLAKENDKTG